MNIFFIDISKIITKNGRDNLQKKYGNYHHHYSHIILKKILNSVYKINPKISDDNGRPYIKNSPLLFSISHSKNIIAIAFNDNDSSNLGLDIEFIKTRDYAKILNYYGINYPNVSQEEFFQIWTTYEAEYKADSIHKGYNLISFKYDNYMVSFSYKNNSVIKYYELNIDQNIDEKPIINEITIPSEKFLNNSEIKLK